MHAVTRAAVSGGLEYQGQSGAINESISDIFGTALERNIFVNPQTATNPNGWDWLLAEDVGVAFRNMANPLASPRGAQPDRYAGPNWANTCNSCPDNGGVHTNSGVMNRWFNMLCTGFNNPNSTIRVNSIDFNRALAIIYRALTTYTQQFSDFGDIRNGTIYAARDLYGNCSMEMRQVQNAWYHVNNNTWSFCDVDCNYTITPSTNNSNPSCNSPITLNANCSGSGCYDIDYTWKIGTNIVGNGQVVNTNTPNTSGSYTYTLYPFKSGCNFTYQDVNFNLNCTPPAPTCPNTGSISYQRWENIGGGTSIQDLRNNTNNLQNGATFSQNLTLFEAPTNILDNYGVRIRGYICPPTTGNYTFWVAGDDNSELWISPNDQPNNLSRVAYHNSWTPSREWNIHSTQQSAPILLQAGQRYYVEALMKEGGGGDNLAVGWRLPNSALERPIPGNRLIPFAGGSSGPACNFSVSGNSSNANPSCGGSITLNAPCSGPDCAGVGYVWSGNGLSQTNQSANTNVHHPKRQRSSKRERLQRRWRRWLRG
jgi:hypothetical protein